MVHSPPILVLDEPTAGVDVELRQQLWAFVRDLNQQGVTVVLTTHYLEEAEQLCDRIAIINHGKLIANEPTRALVGMAQEKVVEVTVDRDVPAAPENMCFQKVELQGEAFTKHIERSGTGYHLKGYDALQGGRIDQQHASLVVDDDAVARGVDEGTLIVDTRLRDALRTLRRDAGPRSFALPSEREESLVLPQPSAADDAAYAVEAAALREAYAVRAQRQLDGLEQRLLSLEEQ